jgi:transposase
LRRDQMERFFAALPATLIGMEACGSAHHWARCGCCRLNTSSRT